MNNNIENIEQDNPIYKAPYLIFNKERRQEAREQVSSLGGCKSEGEDRYEVIELVIRNGLYEYYPPIAELSHPLKINRIFNYISSKEQTPEQQYFKNLEIRRLFWKNVLYPEAVRQICNDTVYEEGKDIQWLWTSNIPDINPPNEDGETRKGYLYDLIRYYKGCDSEIQKGAIKRFLARQVGDYPMLSV